MTDTTVAVIGAGRAGLNAARLLHGAGVDFHLFEARDRAGGRILTVDAKGALAEDGFDLGPSWFWPQMQPIMGELVGARGPQRLPTLAQEPRSMRLFAQKVALHPAPASQMAVGSI